MLVRLHTIVCAHICCAQRRKSFHFGLRAPHLMIDLSVAAGKGTKCVLGCSGGIVQLGETEVFALLDESAGGNAIERFGKFGRRSNNQSLHLVAGLRASLDGRVLLAFEHADHLDFAWIGSKIDKFARNPRTPSPQNRRRSSHFGPNIPRPCRLKQRVLQAPWHAPDRKLAWTLLRDASLICCGYPLFRYCSSGTSIARWVAYILHPMRPV